MADFGSQATALPAPSGAGSQPVTTQYNTVSDGGLFDSAVKNVASLLGEGIKSYQASEQQKLQNAILKDVADKQNVINQGVTQGTITAQEAHVRSGAVFSEAIANYPQLAPQFAQLNSVFKASTGAGDVEADLQSQRQTAQHIAEQQDSAAISQGYYISPTMTKEQRQAVWQAAQANKAAQQSWEQQKQRIEFERSTTTFNQQQADRDNQNWAIKTVNEMAGANFTSFNAQAQSLVDQVNNGTMTLDAAQVQLQQIRNQINGPLQAVAASGKIDAGPYKQMYDQTFEVYNKLLDPKNKSEQLTAQLSNVMNQQKLVILSDPETRNFAATSQLMGGAQNPMLFATGARLTMKALQGASTSPTVNGQPSGFVQPIAGNPEVEGDAYNTIKYGVDQLRAGKMADPAKGLTETNNTVNNVLAQVGQLQYNGIASNPKNLTKSAEFLASPQFAYMVQNGAIDPVAAQAAKKTMQQTYEPAVTQASGVRLQGTLPDSNIQLQNAVDVNFTGAGVSFVVRKGLSDKDAAAAQARVGDLNATTQALNTVIRMGAHLEGSTDYQKYWNDNKYYILPQVYPVKPNQAIKWTDGKTYSWNGNGDWADRSQWTVSGGSTK